MNDGGCEETDQNAVGEGVETVSSSGASAFIRHISQVDGKYQIRNKGKYNFSFHGHQQTHFMCIFSESSHDDGSSGGGKDDAYHFDGRFQSVCAEPNSSLSFADSSKCKLIRLESVFLR